MSPALPFSFLLACALAAVASAGCDVTGFGAASYASPTVEGLPDIDGGDAAAAVGVDAAAEGPTAEATQGSPLCNAAATGGCYPDDATTTKACDLAPDGGVYNSASDYGDTALACRVVATDNGSALDVAPACTPAGAGGDGARSRRRATACRRTTASAVVARPPPAPASATAARATPRASRPSSATSRPRRRRRRSSIPVCMPIHPAGGCQLLDPTACTSQDEQCAVVRENGATSCVAIGTAKAHDGCDTAHCAAGLVCLGAVGQRECYQLSTPRTPTSAPRQRRVRAGCRSSRTPPSASASRPVADVHGHPGIVPGQAVPRVFRGNRGLRAWHAT